MDQDTINIIIALGVLLCALAAAFFWKSDRAQRLERRIARVTNRKPAAIQKTTDVLNLRRKAQEKPVPFIGKLINQLPTQAALKARLERAGLEISAESYVILSAIAFLIISMLIIFGLDKPIFAGILVGIILSAAAPYFWVGIKAGKRLKKFLTQFPEAIDFIVRGLRSGLPVTESMNNVGTEMVEPIRGIFSHIGESIRLGVPVDKAMQDMAQKLGLTEFNFFVTSLVLQRETGGNLSEILNNLSEVLRTRMMMKMKIKAMSSEARASAMIVGALPFLVIAGLLYSSPGYLDPLFDTTTGNIVAVGCALSMAFGIFVMVKMTKFEI